MTRGTTDSDKATDGALRLKSALALGLIAVVAIVAIVVATASIVRFDSSNPKPAVVWRPCGPPVPDDARCGTLDVFENRDAGTGRAIGLNIVVLPATGAAPAPDPVFWLEGGPGGAATQAIGPVSQQYLKDLRAERDLVFVDQRGTGQSNPLRCDLGEAPANLDRYFGRLFPVDLIRACRQALEPVADLARYSTSTAMDDLDDVRKALGYGQINLSGVSYGAIAAQVYMRRHPDRVRSAFLIGVATPGFRLPLPFAKAAQNSLELTFAACAADASCRGAFPNLRTEFDGVLARFANGPLNVNMVDPATQQIRPVRLERESYVEKLRVMLYTTGGARFVPLVVHRAFLQDFFAFQTIATRYNLGASIARGMYLSVTCSESAPFIPEPEIIAETRGTFLGERRVRAHLAACQEWPKADVPRSFLEPLQSTVPMILFSGEADGAVAPWFGEAALRFLTNGRQVRAQETGHQIDGPCTWNLMAAFIRRPVAEQLDTSCASSIQRPVFATDLGR